MLNERRIELQAELFGTLFLLTQHMARRADAAMEPVGLTTKQWLLLAILARKEGEVAPTLSEAAQWYGTSRQNVKQIALQLESRGYLKLVIDPEDRRVLRLRLTEQVSRLDLPTERQRQANLLASLFGGLSDPELAHCVDLILRQVRAIAPHGLV